MADTQKYRYPGLSAYTRHDAAIFKGRSKDAERLATKISLYKTVVLHAESGTGKSSLINAGLIPILENSEENFLPVVIDLTLVPDQSDEDLLVAYIKKEIFKADKSLSSDPLFENLPDSLWGIEKRLERKEKKLLLILDQFENLESFRQKKINFFKRHLYDLVNTKIPQAEFEQLQRSVVGLDHAANELSNEEYYFLSAPSAAKILFVIREDKLGVMNLLSNYFPDILKNDCTITSFDVDAAFKALVEPASVEGSFKSPTFSFEDTNFIKSLIKEIGDDETKLVDPTQLQIVSRNIERNIVIGNNKTLVTKNDVQGVTNIINDFYWEVWKKVSTEVGGLAIDIQETLGQLVVNQQRILVKEEEFNKSQKGNGSNLSSILEKVRYADGTYVQLKHDRYIADNNKLTFDNLRKEILGELITGQKRNLAHANGFSKIAHAESILSILLKEGLVRKTVQGGDEYYQLIHDRLLQPAIEDQNQIETSEKFEAKLSEELEKLRKDQEIRSNERKKTKLVIIALVLGLLALGVGVLAYKLWKTVGEVTEQRVYTTARIIKQVNPALSYKITSDYAVNGFVLNDFENFYNKFDSSQFSFVKYYLPSSAQVLKVSLANTESSPLVTLPDRICQWSRNDGLITQESVINRGNVIAALEINGENRLIVKINRIIRYLDADRKILKEIEIKDPWTQRAVPSYDGKLLLVDNELLDLQKGVSLGAIFEYTTFKDIRSAVFLHDNKHIAVGYESGDIVIFSTKIQNGYLRPVKVMVLPASPTAVTALTIDKNDNFLYAGDQSLLTAWKIEEFYSGLSSDEVFLRANKSPSKRLRGHTGAINCLALSPLEDRIISGSDDNTALVWDLATGEKRTYLKGREGRVTYVNFSHDGKEMITGTEKGAVLIWNIRNPSSQKPTLAKFSPYEYYNVGLPVEEFTPDLVYAPTSVNSLAAATMHYLSTMPVVNNKPQDQEYLEILKTSIRDIDTLYQRLINHPHFHDSVSIPNKKFVITGYNSFQSFNKPELLLEANDGSDEQFFAPFRSYATKVIPALLMDTLEVKSALDVSFYLSSVADSYLHGETRNYEKANYYLNVTINRILQPYLKKYPNDLDLNDKMASLMSLVCSNYINIKFQDSTKNLDSAHQVAKRIEKLKGSEAIAAWCQIRLHLLENDYDKAVALFKKYESVRVERSTVWPLKWYLEHSIKDMDERGISNPTIKSFATFLSKQKNIRHR